MIHASVVAILIDDDHKTKRVAPTLCFVTTWLLFCQGKMNGHSDLVYPSFTNFFLFFIKTFIPNPTMNISTFDQRHRINSLQRDIVLKCVY